MDKKVAYLMFWGDAREVPAKQDRIVITYVTAESRIEKEYLKDWNRMARIRFDDSRELEEISNDLALKLGDEKQTRVNGVRDCYAEIPRFQRGIIGSAFVQYFLKK